MSSLARLIRFPNLVIIALLQILMRYAVVKPILNVNNLELAMPGYGFWFTVLSTVFISAAGYIINDYFDTRSDRINHPDTVIVGRKISRQMTMFWHIAFNAVGILMGLYVVYRSGWFSFGLIFILIPMLLWLYSTTYKRKFLIGNILISFLAAMAPVVVVAFELVFLDAAIPEFPETVFWRMIRWTVFFSLFAFLTNLIREIIKDVQDIPGDKEIDSSTLPIVIGIRRSKHIIYFIALFTVAVLLFIYFRYLDTFYGPFTLYYLVIFIIIPLFGLMYIVKGSFRPEHFKRASLLSKLIMLAGMLYSILLAFIIQNQI